MFWHVARSDSRQNQSLFEARCVLDWTVKLKQCVQHCHELRAWPSVVSGGPSGAMLIAWLEQGHVAIAILCALDEALLCTSHLRRKMPGISKVLQGSPSI